MGNGAGYLGEHFGRRHQAIINLYKWAGGILLARLAVLKGYTRFSPDLKYLCFPSLLRILCCGGASPGGPNSASLYPIRLSLASSCRR